MATTTSTRARAEAAAGVHPGGFLPTDAFAVVRSRTGPRWVRLLTTTDHKQIGYMYLVTSFAFFLLAGVMALLAIRQLRRTLID